MARQLSNGTYADQVYVTEAYTPVGSHTVVNDLSAAVTLTRPAGATMIAIQAGGQNVRLTFDGTTPTSGASGVGFKVLADAPVAIFSVSGPSVKVIQEAPTANLQYQWMA